MARTLAEIRSQLDVDNPVLYDNVSEVQVKLTDQQRSSRLDDWANNIFTQESFADSVGAKRSQIRTFYTDCKNNVATIAQMRSAWQILLKDMYKDYVSDL